MDRLLRGNNENGLSFGKRAGLPSGQNPGGMGTLFLNNSDPRYEGSAGGIFCMSSASVTTWIGLLKAGQGDAAQALWQRYFTQLVELAHQHLSRHVQHGGNAEDVALAAFAGFCLAARNGRFPKLTDRHDLWRLLLTITLRRARDQARQELRERRSGARTVLASDLIELGNADLDRLASEAPDPAVAAEVADEFRHLLAKLPGDDLRAVVPLLLAGHTAPEIARHLGCSLRTVERRWQRIREFWAEG